MDGWAVTDAEPRPELAVSVPGAPHVTGAPTPAGPAGVDPLTAPLTYPGTPPRRPAVLVTDGLVLELEPRGGAPLGEWLVQTDTNVSSDADGPPPALSTTGPKTAVTTTDARRRSSRDPDPGRPYSRHPGPPRSEPRPAEPGPRGPGHSAPGHRDVVAVNGKSGFDLGEIPLDRYLGDVGGRPAASLTPVLAVGSNASPAQLRRKLANAGRPARIPITAVSVRGLAVGVSAHVSRPGYLPATPVPSPGTESDLWVLWLDQVALAAIDVTEPNYDRILLPDRYPVRLTTGQPVTGCWVYRSRPGYLLNQAGEPRRLTDQPTLISALLAEVPALPPLAGTSPQEWIERTRDAAVRDAVRDVFGSVGMVGRVREL